MPERTALTRASSQELETARTKGQVLGWIQGAGAVLVFGLVLKLVGWIPLILVAIAGAYLAFKVLFGKDKA